MTLSFWIETYIHDKGYIEQLVCNVKVKNLARNVVKYWSEVVNLCRLKYPHFLGYFSNVTICGKKSFKFVMNLQVHSMGCTLHVQLRRNFTAKFRILNWAIIYTVLCKLEFNEKKQCRYFWPNLAKPPLYGAQSMCNCVLSCKFS